MVARGVAKRGGGVAPTLGGGGESDGAEGLSHLTAARAARQARWAAVSRTAPRRLASPRLLR